MVKIKGGIHNNDKDDGDPIRKVNKEATIQRLMAGTSATTINSTTQQVGN